MHANSYQLFLKYALPMIEPGMRVLEIGPEFESSPGEYESLYSHIIKVGATYACAGPSNNFPSHTMAPMLGDYSFDCVDSYFDIVLSANVAEHVRALWRWFPEQVRITKPKGLVISISPNSWPYHASPVDCWRIYPDGYRALFNEADLEMVHTSCESLAPIEPSWAHEHGADMVWDTIAIGRKK